MESLSSPSMDSSSTTSAMVDNSNPFYLHNGDIPGATLVSQQLVGDNYNTWSRSMKMALIAKNKFSFIDGTLSKPDASSSDFLPWTRCNNMIVSWILKSVSGEIGTSIVHIDTAEDMWNDLRDRFSQKNGARVFQLQQAISALSQENNSVSSYFNSLKGLWDELNNYRSFPPCSCGAMKVPVEYRDHEYVFQFLMGLNETFSHIRGQILLIDPLPPINKVFSMILQEERQRQIVSSTGIQNNNTAAMMTTAPQTRSQAYKPRFGRKDRPKCADCGRECHTVDKCYKLHGFLQGYKFRGGIKFVV